MRAYLRRLLLVCLFFAALIAGMNYLGRKLVEQGASERNVVTGRINSAIQEWVDGGSRDADAIVAQVFTQKIKEWCGLYGANACPYEVRVLFFSQNESQELGLKLGEDSSKICGLYEDGRLVGLAEYQFRDASYGNLLMLMNGCVFLSLIAVILYGLWVFKRVLLPFHKLSEYPERLSKGAATEKLPETKDHIFGKYVWGMNMLSDKLENDRQTIRRIADDRQKMVTMLVHGIKTPAANIKLLSEAIATGLYDPEGKVNEKDAELAGKIEKNADDIEKLVSQAVEATNTVSIEYEPEIKAFYRSQIEKFLQEEYQKRLEIQRIPLRIERDGDPIIDSDLDGICRILRQMMDNAIKYGDGTGICLKMDKTEEGHFLTVSNQGETLPESELPFVFNSLWRGSNAANIKGSGIGLYEARMIAKRLGGDIRMRTGDHETMVTLFLPISNKKATRQTPDGSGDAGI
ncbi:MAG: HAMP domain-containing histidine kinase [Lachnospiraceae bacterium]|nr:HAMP domain-containing histidine kinase [Lachnospiraceae bacterium]